MRNCLFAIVLLINIQSFSAPKPVKKVLLLMGSRFEITAIHNDETLATQAVEACISEVTRIEKLISSWDPNSQTSEVIRNAGIQPVKVDRELFDLISRAKKISKLTNGAFDISYASMDKIWKFDGSVTQLPTEEQVQASVSKINYNNIILDKENSTVFLKEEGMKIGFGAIGKGYAANRGKQIMQTMGIENGIVNASGDLITWGKEANGKEWSIGIGDPKNKGQVLAWVTVGELAVVTSGNYEKVIKINGENYSHIIDPTTGWPVKGLKSVTIFCPDAELADALATSVFILGKEKGLSLVNQLKGVEAFLVDDKDEIHTSSALKLNYYEEESINQTAHNLTIGHEKK
ncbi:FAD:protein FMN transferase [Fulvivirga lutea]|uniref:FAD:protein FMN transferase n=1 Tax=Fulvivirga lutea TaxID=2810512 RepID=A0A975A197_9BACT|nr:FAD:protein FMN transferase [Fulvivirga lutea]QSE98214.1 FAD:protein FMN transferase [Fulvivirga lutea]